MSYVSDQHTIENLYSLLRKGQRIEIDVELYMQYFIKKSSLFKNKVINGLTISHAYEPNAQAYSQRIYFYEKRIGDEWHYYAQLAWAFHVSCTIESDLID